ncbi:MAG: hypothetical protein R2882_05720 [Gemmatimonadales bacterium]
MSAQAAFVAAGGYHHHIGLNTWESEGGRRLAARHHGALPPRNPVSDPGQPWPMRPAPGASFAVLPDGASDHGVSEALYLRDPDQNGVELYSGPARRGLAAGRGRRAGDGHPAA